METLKCYKCNEPKLAEANFCIKCGVQQKCKSCKTDISMASQNFCNQCGDPINSSNSNNQRNFVEYEKKGQSVKLKADLTDNGSHDLSFVIAAAIAGNAPTKKPLFSGQNLAVQNKLGLTPSTKQMGGEVIPFLEVTDEGLATALERILKTDADGNIEINDQRVKHKSKRDQQIRLTLLLLYAYKLNGKEKIEKNLLTGAMNKVKLNDGNWRGWFGAETKLFIPSGDLVELKPAGEEAAKKYIGEILDDNYVPGTTTRRGTPKKKKEVSGTTSEVGKKNKSGKPTALEIVEILMNEKYFQTKRAVGEIEKYCTQHKGYTYIRQEIQNSLTRLLREQKIKREINKETNKYEYYS